MYPIVLFPKMLMTHFSFSLVEECPPSLRTKPSHHPALSDLKEIVQKAHESTQLITPAPKTCSIHSSNKSILHGKERNVGYFLLPTLVYKLYSLLFTKPTRLVGSTHRTNYTLMG
jgi:hypothetical protein